MFTQRFRAWLIGLVLLGSLLNAADTFPAGSAQAQATFNPKKAYNPPIDPTAFTVDITNPYFALPVGQQMVYEAETADGVEQIEILIPGWTREVMGIETLVYWDRVYHDGELVEDTRDYLAQNKETGDVWYFGEHVDNYVQGKLKDHNGSWLAGVDGAKPGIWMLANPQVGNEFRNEYYQGHAEDITKILAIDTTVTIPSGAYKGCIKTLEWTPLSTITENKYYCYGVGRILIVDLPGPDVPVEQKEVLAAVDPSGARDMTIVPAAYAQEGVVGPSTKPTSDRVTCAMPAGVTIPMPTTYLYFEHNATAEDTGIHGMFDSSTFAELCVYDPHGNQILAVKPQHQLASLTMAGIFFESREPAHADVPVEEHLRNFPEGQYAVRAVTYDGIGYQGAATLTHQIPQAPQMIFPTEMADEAEIATVLVAPRAVVFQWKPVTETIFGAPVEIAGYEVIVRRLTAAHPHGFAHANYDVHVPPTVTSLSVPDGFWEPNMPYEWEVLALEESGNQTIVSGFFMTKK